VGDKDLYNGLISDAKRIIHDISYYNKRSKCVQLICITHALVDSLQQLAKIK